jgi:TPR repeat protein
VPDQTEPLIRKIDAAIDAENYAEGLNLAAKTLAKLAKAIPKWNSEEKVELSEDATEILFRLDKCSAELLAKEAIDTRLLELLDKLLDHNRTLSPHTSALVGFSYYKLNQPADAFKWLLSASEVGYIQANRELALLYERGSEDRAPAPDIALACLRELTENPSHDTRDNNYTLAAMILRGTAGTPPAWDAIDFGDAEKPAAADAVAILSKNHEQGHARSAQLLAQCFATGTGVKLDEKRAFELFLETVESEPTAYHNLGICYEIGYGTSKDLEEALDCYDTAADRGFQPATGCVKRVETALQRLKGKD